jgi:hypothetical protein
MNNVPNPDPETPTSFSVADMRFHTDGVKTFNRHGSQCPTQEPHFTGKPLGHCLWPNASIRGFGPWAVVTRCSGVRVRMFRTRVAAQNEKDRIDVVLCCQNCRCRHELVRIADALVGGL